MSKYTEEGCPEGMYPMDSDYEAEVHESLDELIARAEFANDALNFPISWYITHDNKYGEEDSFQLVFLMPRKHGRTWSMNTRNFDPEKAEAWVKDYTRRAATEWFGWDE